MTRTGSRFVKIVSNASLLLFRVHTILFLDKSVFINNLILYDGAYMEKELLFITVIGGDKKGIVAKISNLLYECDINIEDISQKIMDKYFVMTMLVDMKESKFSLEKVREDLEKIGEELKLKVQIQHENIFKMMHRI